MRRLLFASLFLLVCAMGLVLACSWDYTAELKQEVESDNVTLMPLEGIPQVQSTSSVVTWVVRDYGISVDSVTQVGDFYRGAEADVVYMIRNESSSPVVPMIYFKKGSRVDDYSYVDGRGFRDAPDYVEDWITVSPEPSAIAPQSAQGYVVALVMPKDVPSDFPKKFAFVMAVARDMNISGASVSTSVGSWWLVSLR